MRARLRLTLTVLFVAVLSISGATAAGDGEADRAFAAGDHDRALELYERALEDDPDDVRALFRTALLLSWSQRFDEALDRYGRVLELDPDDDRAALERAKVLSWARRFDEAAEAFEDLLERQPDSRDALLGLARTRSWSGRQRAARSAYLELLDRDPGDADAAVGVAQTWAWSDEPRRARTWYRRALEIEPGKREAVLGLAYLDLWRPDRREAGRRVQDLRDRFADDAEVSELAVALDRAGGWWSAVGWDRFDDTDDNRMDVLRIETGTGVGPSLDVAVGVARYDLEGPTGGARIESLHGTAGWQASRADRLTFRLGNDRIESTTGARDGEVIGGVAWRHAPDRIWRLDASWQRDSLRYSPAIADADIVLERASLGATVDLAAAWDVSVTASRWDASDSNARDGQTVEIAYRWPSEPVTLETAYVLDHADWDRDLDNGYFDPQDFLAHLLEARVRGQLPMPGGWWRVTAIAGLQSFELSGVEVDEDTVVGVRARVMVPLGSRFHLDVHAGWSDYAAQTASGFESTTAGARLRWIW